MATDLSNTDSRTSAPAGFGLHIGLNEMDPAHYEARYEVLEACRNDAHSMAALGKANGLRGTVMLDSEATRERVIGGIRAAAGRLQAGDFFLLTYSGHGGQVPDVTGDEDDPFDETWCLHDGQLIDDELYLELSRFASGVRILVLSDSCHSGSMVRAAAGERSARIRQLPPSVAQRVYEQHRKFYDDLQKDITRRAGTIAEPRPSASPMAAMSKRAAAIDDKFGAALVLISGCQDHEYSYDGDVNGAFTEKLLVTWGNGAFKGNYVHFHASIARTLDRQHPNLLTLGSAGNFLAQRPFTL